MIYTNDKPIAILLAVYNGEKYLREQVDSILRQTNHDWTLYIRDDGSKDNTINIIKEYVDKYPNIIQVQDNDGNLGCRGNFFRLLEVVESKYYMFSDADDVWFENKVQISYDAIREIDKGENLPIIVHTTYSVTDQDLNVKIENYWEATHFVPEKFYSYNLIALANPVGGAEMTFNHYLKTLLFPLADNTLLHDRWIPMVAAKHGGIFKAIHEPVQYYRMHANNLYGVQEAKNAGQGCIDKIKRIYRTNKLVADKLVQAGWGSYAKYIVYKLVYMCKRRF